MILWASLTFALFSVFSIHTQAEVVNSFQRCSQYFYKGKEPRDFDQNAKKICQKMDGRYFFATLYSTYHRIPLYSAYTFDYGCNNQEGRKSGNWFIEPQLSVNENPAFANMDNMQSYTTAESQFIKVKQAINADYSNTGYDRGHLNPNSFQCNDGRKATFTLTNGAPMDACSNRVHWKEWEAAVRSILKVQDSSGTAYLVTGAVPASDNRIPRQGPFDDPNTRDFDRVTVPTRVWTAVCYIHPSDQEENFSFGFIGLNQQQGSIHVKTVEELTCNLSLLTEKMVKKLYIEIEEKQASRLNMSPDVVKKFYTAESFSDSEATSYRAKRTKITEVKTELVYDSIDTWWKGTEEIKFVSGLACPLSTPLTGPVKSSGNNELQQRRHTFPEVVCTLVPEKLDGCSTSCLYNEESKDYYCSSGSTKKPCSPRYSDVTVSGEKCKSDHTCGKHGYDYYWCYTASSWNYCSSPLPLGVTESGKRCSVGRNCAKYSRSGKYWCEPEDGKWDKCCRRADRFSAVNGRTCKTDSPCGYYGHSYRWCYTTDGTWDYCCTI
ncbi:hypothetical protein Q5P01_007137 [Channa striata]|uniref:Uncharacterized protein n=1 Tax=Channa striata TaxID=64152 RepID=A0AA88NBC5_CHASR|nr:hypothetical protein Q5P01_007137 [Channa striata]